MRVQSRSCDQSGYRSAVKDIPHQRMTHRRSVDADLMRSPRHRRRLHQRPGLIAFQQPESRLRVDPVPVIHHRAMPAPHIHPQGKLRRLLLPSRRAIHQRMIRLPHLMPLELDAQRTMRLRRQGKQHNTARPLINTMHNPDPPKFRLEQPRQKRRILIPPLRQDRQPRRLIHRRQGRITKQDLKIYHYPILPLRS